MPDHITNPGWLQESNLLDDGAVYTGSSRDVQCHLIRDSHVTHDPLEEKKKQSYGDRIHGISLAETDYHTRDAAGSSCLSYSILGETGWYCVHVCTVCSEAANGERERE